MLHRCLILKVLRENFDWVKIVRTRSYCGPHLVRLRENMDQNNSEYENLSHSACPNFETTISILYFLLKTFQ